MNDPEYQRAVHACDVLDERGEINDEIELARSLTPAQRLSLCLELSDRALACRSEPVDRLEGLEEKARLGRVGKLLQR